MDLVKDFSRAEDDPLRRILCPPSKGPSIRDTDSCQGYSIVWPS